MSYIDVAIPLLGGILMVACPQIFIKRTPLTTDADVARKTSYIRNIGFVLLAVAALYFLLSLTRT